MTQASYQQKCQARLQAAIASIQEHEDVFGKFCTVHSTSEKIGIYSIDLDENLYATSCTCPGNADHGYDCLHMLACDRHFDGRRPSFYEGIRKLEKPAPIVEIPQEDGTIEVETVQEDGSRKQVATIRRIQPEVETVPVTEVMAQANEAMVRFDQDCQMDYDLLGSTKTTAAEREAKRLEEEETRQANVRYMYNDL